MAAADDKTDSNDVCAEFVQSTISVIPSLLGLLIFLASLRDPDTGKFHDRVFEILLQLNSAEAATGPVRSYSQVADLPGGKARLDLALRQEHLAVFEDWLCLSLRQQMAELARYSASQDTPPPTLFRKWIQEEFYKRFVPFDTMPVQRQLFLTDMETVLASMLLRAFWP